MVIDGENNNLTHQGRNLMLQDLLYKFYLKDLFFSFFLNPKYKINILNSKVSKIIVSLELENKVLPVKDITRIKGNLDIP